MYLLSIKAKISLFMQMQSCIIRNNQRQSKKVCLYANAKLYYKWRGFRNCYSTRIPVGIVHRRRHRVHPLAAGPDAPRAHRHGLQEWHLGILIVQGLILLLHPIEIGSGGSISFLPAKRSRRSNTYLQTRMEISRRLILIQRNMTLFLNSL